MAINKFQRSRLTFDRSGKAAHIVVPSIYKYMFCLLNILKSLGWIFIKPCKHDHICKTHTLNKTVRARGQFIRDISLCSSKWLYAYANIGHTQADQLLTQLLREHFDTLPIQCRHIEHILGQKRNAAYKD